jgi:uncharacterized membrane protein YgaE (UPF0421/DUF939 family)
MLIPPSSAVIYRILCAEDGAESKIQMTIPSLLFGLIIALLIGALFHTIRGGNGWRLLTYILISCLGFFLTNWFGKSLGWSLYPFGVLDAGLGVVGSVIFLIIGDWLTRIESNKKSGV